MNRRPNTGKEAAAAPASSSKAGGITSRPWWPWTKRLVSAVFFILVAYLLVSQARSIEWSTVFAALRRRPPQDLWFAAALAGASYALYSCFDLIGRHTTGHRLSVPKVMTVNFISYAFNLNMGALVGGLAFRYRLYSQLGLAAEVTTRVVFMSMLTNWLGYLLLAGLVFLWSPIAPPPDWQFDKLALQALGAVLLAIAVGYVLLCALARRRNWTVRGNEVTLPSLRLALLQLTLSSANWLLMAGAVYILLEQKIAFPVVLGVLLAAAIAGVITHVPAGLGVLEAVFIALLSYQLPKSELLAALLAYRAIYYIAPLIVAALVYLLVEMRIKNTSRSVRAPN